ncbi:DMT family transporter [Alteromonas aestuariivivens]|uniref:DMT family transporter n=1 Tax=Alteromonas aestuariivivens TaxID=1938339 RepID=A0A3D8M8G7_9ALTE|nr:DMT family transporter [Alteromonas aestuariivivens]RDV25501.1 DMT family transporter [Alteromonas aestuariivivens]
MDQQRLANTLLFTVTLLAAVGWLFSVHVLVAVTPMLFLTIRFVSAAILVGAAKPAEVLRLPWRWRWRAMVSGALLGTQTTVWALAVVEAEGIGVGAFLMSLSFVLIPVTGLAFGYRAKPHTWLALAIAIPGLALLAMRHGFSISVPDALFLLSAVMSALYFNINGRICATIPAIAQTSYQMLGAGLASGVGYFLFEMQLPQSFGSVWHWLIMSILIGTCMRFFFMLKAQMLAPEGQGAVIMILEPVWVAVLGIVFLNEAFSTEAILGMALIFLALLVNAVGAYRGRRAGNQSLRATTNR